MPILSTKQPSLDDKYLLSDGHGFMTGIQALVRLPLEQRRRDTRAGHNIATFISGYQGSPLGTYDMELERAHKLLDEHKVVFRPGVNEELAATSVMGTQLIDQVGQQRYDGVTGIWYGKAPGVDRATDAFRHANLIGVPPTGGAVVLAGDDPAAKSSTLPCASEGALFDLGIPFLFPGDVQEVLDFGIHAIAMSRCSGLWAGMKIVTQVADGSATVDLSHDRVQPRVVSIVDNGRVIVHRPNAMLIGAQLQELERTQWNARLDAARRYITLNKLNRVTNNAPNAEVGIVAPGKSYVDLIEALHRMGLDGDAIAAAGIRLLKVGAPYPMDPELIREFAHGLREIIVLEEKREFIEMFVKDALYGAPNQPRIVGKHDENGTVLMPANGEGSPDLFARLLAPRLHGHDGEPLHYAGERTRIQLPLLTANTTSPSLARTPYFCSGCPHNVSTKVPDGALVGAGIGCHGLVMVMDEKQVGNIVGVTQMGGEGAQWIGMSPFTKVPHLFQDIGDGTFMHSGSLAIRAAVAAGVNITYKLLYNSAVAMTGGQEPVGAMTVPGIVRLLLNEGVRKVVVTTEDTRRYRGIKLPKGVQVLDRSRLLQVEEDLAGIQGVTVLLHDQECAAEKRRKRKRGKLDDPVKRIAINERVCEGCGDCGEKSNCLSVEPVDTEFGRKTAINQSSCNKDYTCVTGDCPSFLEVVPGGRARKKIEQLGPDDIAAPSEVIQRADFSMRITGIGGTGVVTLAQVLATAASLDGWTVRGLDQTGVAQKGGPVVSDLRFTSKDQVRTNKLASVDCDLYLGCDILVAAAESNLVAADPVRTVGVVSSAIVPTGSMVVDTSVKFPQPAELEKRIAEQIRPAALHMVDARSLTESLFGSSQCENILLVGVAFQTGALPLSAESIETAITLNGVATEVNLQAFRRGRQMVSAPEALAKVARVNRPRTAAVRRGTRQQKHAEAVLMSIDALPDSELARVLNVRVPELIAYQNARYAQRYADVVERIRALETVVVGPDSEALTTAVAHNLFKLMAYKDEAEVARLNIDGQLQVALEQEFGPGVRAKWKLHPPIFRAMGLDRKITLGPWFKPAFHVLYATRHLRGTRFNPFGPGEVRRLERELIDEYIGVLKEIEQHLTLANYNTAIEIAELPDIVRGYEEIKIRNTGAYRKQLAGLLVQFTTPAAATSPS
ncbi:indolepyruvate ferredoxin oxidoreductase family protein [Nocardia sp. NPDC055053]